MHVSGEIIFFRHESGSRALKGEVIGCIDGMYQIKGMRSATKHARPVYLIPSSQVFPVQEIGRNKPVKYHREFHGRGLSTPLSESILRKQATETRMGMNEGEILQSKAMTGLKRRIVRSLASKNHIPSTSQDFTELESEFLVAALSALRTVASKASTEEIGQFKSFLAGSEEHFFCRIVLNIARTGKTACIRYLNQRQQYQRNHISIELLGRRIRA